MRVLKISGKCSDCFSMTMDGRYYDGYVPGFLGGGDYIELDIDLDTGKILNWKPIDEIDKELEECFGENEEKDDRTEEEKTAEDKHIRDNIWFTK
jgi:hypothetical protein